MKKYLPLLILLLLVTSVSAATLKGTIYNTDLEIENNVLIEIDTIPVQKFLAKKGTYSLELGEGNYQITATKGLVSSTEDVEIVDDREYVFDIFLLPDFSEENELWQESEEQYFTDDEEESIFNWRNVLVAIVVVALIVRFVLARKKYGSLRRFRKFHQAEGKKSTKQHRKEIEAEPGYLDRVVEIIKSHGGRVHQKQLRKEMLDVSEAKISLILTELEHNGKVEKIKKGRGNVIILKEKD